PAATAGHAIDNLSCISGRRLEDRYGELSIETTDWLSLRRSGYTYGRPPAAYPARPLHTPGREIETMAWMRVRRSGYRWDTLNSDTADRRVPIQAASPLRRPGYRYGGLNIGRTIQRSMRRPGYRQNE